MTQKLFLTLILVCSLPAGALGQSKNTGLLQHAKRFTELRRLLETDLRVTARRVAGASEDYRLATGDVIGIEILEAESLSGNFEIQSDGTVQLALLGNVKAAGSTALELESKISDGYDESGLIRSPEVLVRVIGYRGKPYYVFGEVDLSGQYIMSQRLTVLDAILVAGGLKGPAGDFGYLHRHAVNSEAEMASTQDLVLSAPSRPAGDATAVVKIDLRPLKEGGLLEKNPLIEEGDVFVVPRREIREFFVIGEVNTPGGYELPENGELFATQGIAQAGGPLKTAKTKDGILIRMSQTGERTEIPVDFRKLLTGRTPDFSLQQDDVLFIPGSGAKTVAYGALGMVPWRAQRTASTAIRRQRN